MKRNEIKRILTKLTELAKSKPSSLPKGTEYAAKMLVQMLDTTDGDNCLTDLKLVGRKENIGSLLIKLAELSKFGKREWLELIKLYGLKVTLNPRDSVRDVMGKLARHLRENPNALAHQPSKPLSGSSPGRTGKKRKPLAEDLQDTLQRLLNE